MKNFEHKNYNYFFELTFFFNEIQFCFNQGFTCIFAKKLNQKLCANKKKGSVSDATKKPPRKTCTDDKDCNEGLGSI